MNYRARVKWSAACSLLLHLLLVGSIYAYREPTRYGPLANKPLRLTFEQQPQIPRQLVEPRVPSEVPPEHSDQIAEFNALAADRELRPGDRPGPLFDVPNEVDTLATAPPAMPEPAPAPQAKPPEKEPTTPPAAAASEVTAQEEPLPEPATKARDALDKKESTEGVGETIAAAAEEPGESPANETEAATGEGDGQPAEDPGRFNVAKAAVPDLPPGPPTSKRGRTDNAVNRIGFTNFEAIQDEIAPYLRQIRRKVELRWNQALLTRYSGVSPTEATIDCAIAPDGRLVSVEVVGQPDDRIYAALCRNAIERAAPFGPFPFEVPDIYRGKNLEIRWTFSFL